MINAFLVALIAFIIAVLLVYIEARLFDQPRDVTTYIKVGALVALVSGTVVYLMGSPKLPRIQVGGDNGSSNLVTDSTNVSVVDSLNEEMMTGNANF